MLRKWFCFRTPVIVDLHERRRKGVPLREFSYFVHGMCGDCFFFNLTHLRTLLVRNRQLHPSNVCTDSTLAPLMHSHLLRTPPSLCRDKAYLGWPCADSALLGLPLLTNIEHARPRYTLISCARVLGACVEFWAGLAQCYFTATPTWHRVLSSAVAGLPHFARPGFNVCLKCFVLPTPTKTYHSCGHVC